MENAIGRGRTARAAAPQPYFRIMISQKAKYAFQALLALAAAPEGEQLVVSEIAERHNIPRKFLEQILLDLKNHGVLVSRRGKSGGYALLRSPADITFGEVLRIIDGPIAPLPCLSRMAYRRCAGCPDEAACGIRHVFAEAYAATTSVLDRRTLADGLACAPADAEFETAEARIAAHA
jgi:Rrf2 family protein